MNRKIADVLLRYGVSKEDYVKCLPQIRRNNQVILGIFSGVLAVFFTALMILEGNNNYFGLRLIAWVISLAWFLVIWKKGNSSPLLVKNSLYLILLVAFGITGYQGTVLNPEMYCTSFLLVLAAFPVLLMDRPAPLFTFMTLSSVVYLCAVWMTKNPKIVYGDFVNVILALLWGMIGHFGLSHIRIKGMMDRATLQSQAVRNEEMMGNTPVGICRMHMPA